MPHIGFNRSPANAYTGPACVEITFLFGRSFYAVGLCGFKPYVFRYQTSK